MHLLHLAVSDHAATEAEATAEATGMKIWCHSKGWISARAACAIPSMQTACKSTPHKAQPCWRALPLHHSSMQQTTAQDCNGPNRAQRCAVAQRRWRERCTVARVAHCAGKLAVDSNAQRGSSRSAAERSLEAVSKRYSWHSWRRQGCRRQQHSIALVCSQSPCDGIAAAHWRATE